MGMLKRLFILLLLSGMVCSAYGQSDSMRMRFMDVELPIGGVGVFSRNGIAIAYSDTAGFVKIPKIFMQLGYLIAMKQGYEPDTIRQYAPNVYLNEIHNALQEVVVQGGATTQKVLHSGNEYVVDYAFAGDEIIVASYSGDFGGHAKLFLLNNYGDTADVVAFPQEPLYLYKSCVGKIYVVSYGKFYPIQVANKHLSIGQPYDIKYLRGMKECQAMLDGNLYYKRCNADSFIVRYSYLEKGDSIFHEFLGFKDSVAYIGSHEEDFIHYTEDDRLKQMPKFEVGLLKQLWDRGSLRMIDLPLFVKEDSLILFDFYKKQIRYFNHIGVEVKTVPCYFDVNKNLGATILKDEGKETFYLFPNGHHAVKWIQEIDIQTGTLGFRKFKINKPYAENIKVHNGHIYYLWQDHLHAGTMQLYVLTP